MACFLVSVAEAAVVTVVEKAVKKHEEKSIDKVVAEDSSDLDQLSEVTHTPLSRKLSWLRNMLLGGSVLLLFEHIWHGEIVPYFPFLTAMSDPADMMEMFKEMATVGVCMALLITFVWGIICFAVSVIEKRTVSSESAEIES
ncbi:MAG: hypothetical protein K5865_10780 [Eubacterium sp.]|nr:hypothetical protein [Eubacterium sp.]